MKRGNMGKGQRLFSGGEFEYRRKTAQMWRNLKHLDTARNLRRAIEEIERMPELRRHDKERMLGVAKGQLAAIRSDENLKFTVAKIKEREINEEHGDTAED